MFVDSTPNMSAEFSAEKPDFSVEKMHNIAGDKSPPSYFSPVRRRLSPESFGGDSWSSHKHAGNSQDSFRISNKAKKQRRI